MSVFPRSALSTVTALALCALPAVGAAASPATTATCPSPTVTRTALPLPAGLSSVTPVAISPNGRFVVANVVTSAFGFHAMRWADGVATQVDSAGSDFGLVRSVNDAGAAVGLEFSAAGAAKAFVRTLSGVRTISLPGYSVTPYGINRRGQVALVLQDATGVTWAGRWQAGTVTRIGRIQLTGPAGGPVIDDDGNLAYAAPIASGRTHAVFYDAAASKRVQLPMPTGLQSPIITAIGPRRAVVASSITYGRNDLHAVQWPRPWLPGVQLPTTTGLGQTTPAGINAGGVMVGTEYVPSDDQGIFSTGRPVTWTDGVPTRLPVPDPTLSDRAVAINDAGTVVGNEEVGSSTSRALAWTCGQQLTPLTDGTETTSSVLALSQTGVVLGTYRGPSDAKPVPTLWTIG